MILLVLVLTSVAADGGDHRDHEHHQHQHADTHGDGQDNLAVRNAIDKLDKQFLYLLSAITGLVDPTLFSLSVSCEESSLLSQSYGWALIGGGTADTLADYIGNMRNLFDVLSMPDVIYSYLYNMGYGLGFAGPFLLPTYLGSCDTDCSSTDFTSLAQRYGFTQGLQGQYIGESKIHNFGLDAKEALGCLIQQKGDSKEAARVDYLIDDMVDAGVQVVRLEKRLGLV